MWHEVDQVPWVTLTHNYGDASDVPGLLRGCADPQAGVALDALADLGNVLYHQGGWVCPAATAALPFLVELALDTTVHYRDEITQLIGWIAREATIVAPRFLDVGWPGALALAVPRILALLADPDPAVRREATVLAARGGLPFEAAAAALRTRWRAEPDRVTRWDLVLALGALAARNPGAADLTAELHGLLNDEDPQIRLAAVHALAEAEPEVAPGPLGALIDAVLHDDTAGWQSSAWIGGTRAAIVSATGQLLHRDPVAAAAFTIGVSASPDPEQRIATLAQAAGLLAGWRTVTPALLPFAGGQLAAAEAEARYRAAYLLGCLGAEAAAYADRLAELTSDEAMRDSRLRYTVGDAAVWALARQHDPRCLPGLAGRLTGDRLGFDDRSSYAPRDTQVFWFSQPGLAETLAPLREHAADLVVPVLARIAMTPDVLLAAQLCDVLAGWGSAAAEAVPGLLRLLEDDARWPAAARALGGIGPAAAPAGGALRRRAEADSRESAAAWAHWRVTAEPDLALTVLVPMVGDEVQRPVLRQVADLGAHAISAEPRLRLLTESPDEWIRVEAARTHWQVSGDPAVAVRLLTGVARPLLDGQCVPITQVALRYLAEIGAPAAPAAPIAEAVLASPRRLSYFASWRAFTEDEDLRTSAAALTALST